MQALGQPGRTSMVDNFALALSHGLILVAAWRLLFRPDLDDDAAQPVKPKTPFLKRRSGPDA